jgi:hypothetical protein
LLKAVLFAEYGGFVDRRIKDLAKSSTFIVDDRGPSDLGADRKLYSNFCLAFADVLDDDTVEVSLRGNVPNGSGVEAWIKENAAAFTPGIQASLEFTIKKGEQRRLWTLAEALRDIVGPGKRYQTANYKYVCPRTAAALERLAKILDEAWQS